MVSFKKHFATKHHLLEATHFQNNMVPRQAAHLVLFYKVSSQNLWYYKARKDLVLETSKYSDQQSFIEEIVLYAKYCSGHWLSNNE